MANTFKSKNLIYRALDFPSDDAFILTRIRDHQSQAQSYAGLPLPGSKKDFEDVKKYYESCLIIVVICLPASASEGGAEKEQSGGEGSGGDVPIGTISLNSLAQQLAHHRRSDIGIQMVEGYRGKGYGSEAIEWILQYGFQIAGLHRIGMSSLLPIPFISLVSTSFVVDGCTEALLCGITSPYEPCRRWYLCYICYLLSDTLQVSVVSATIKEHWISTNVLVSSSSRAPGTFIGTMGAGMTAWDFPCLSMNGGPGEIRNSSRLRPSLYE